MSNERKIYEKEEFRKMLLECQIFEELKDGFVGGAEYIRGKYQGTGIDFTRLYTKIVNYRIKKYGNSFTGRTEVYRTRSDYERLSTNAKHRKQYRLRGK